MSAHIYRGGVFHLLDDPAKHADAAIYYEDGGLLVEDGHVVRACPWAQMAPVSEAIAVTHLPDSLLVPGFVDAHVHYPQMDAIGGYGKHLLDWLERYAFPAEMAFDANEDHAQQTASFFLNELLRNGTTSALVFATVHAHSVAALFGEALKRNMRLITGKVLMDRNAPNALLDNADTGYTQSKALIEQWQGKGRLGYAITPRFAPTSTEAQLLAAGRLLREYPQTLLHTHLCENPDEIAWVDELFPDANGYTDVYARAGLVTERSVFAHCVHLEDDERSVLAKAGSAIAFCPTSNLFLGSGLFDLEAAQAAGIKLSLGSDVGAGTSLCAFAAMNEGYKVAQLRGQSLHPFTAFYLATLGGARALHIDQHIGNFAPGKEADFIVLDLAATPLLKRRLTASKSIEETLFALSMMGDDRAIRRTYVAGRLAHDRDA
jgi:guanine deaminase